MTTSNFFTQTGANMAEIYVALAVGDEGWSREWMNPCSDGIWIRGADCLPVLVKREQLEKYQDALKGRFEGGWNRKGPIRYQSSFDQESEQDPLAA